MEFIAINQIEATLMAREKNINLCVKHVNFRAKRCNNIFWFHDGEKINSDENYFPLTWCASK